MVADRDEPAAAASSSLEHDEQPSGLLSLVLLVFFVALLVGAIALTVVPLLLS